MIQLKTSGNHSDSSERREMLSRAFDTTLSEDHGGFLGSFNDQTSLNAVEAWASLVRSETDQLALIGVGGSHLGPQSLSEFLGMTKGPPSHQLVFFDNLDPLRFEQKWKSLNFEKTHFLVISKTGSTLETLALSRTLYQKLKKAKKFNPKNWSFVLAPSAEGSPLEIFAREHQIPVIPIKDHLSGRYSVLSPVGYLPLSYLGESPRALIEGAEWALQQKGLVLELCSQTLRSWDSQAWLTAFWSYSDSLETFGRWMVQLWSESLAKAERRDGALASRVSTPLAVKGSCDQHSVLQQFQDGFSDTAFFFVRVKNWGTQDLPVLGGEGLPFSGELSMGSILSFQCEATYQSLVSAGKTCSQLELERLDLQTLGALFMVSQLWVATLGEALNINAFNQPGVEKGKKVTSALLAQHSQPLD